MMSLKEIDSYLSYIEEKQKNMSENNNYYILQEDIKTMKIYIEKMHFFFILILYDQIQKFTNSQINLKISYHQLYLENFSKLYTIFLKDGEEDSQNINKVLVK